MEKGLGDLGFWLAVGIVLAAMIVSGALKEREKERAKQALLRALLERDTALVGREGEGITEILAYLREKDAEEAARAQAKKIASRREARPALAIMTVVVSLVFGSIAFVTKPPRPMLLPLPLPGHPLGYLGYPLGYSPPPESATHLIVAIGIWAAGLIIAALIMFWGRIGKQKNDAQRDV
jgi:hypothetical protein